MCIRSPPLPNPLSPQVPRVKGNSTPPLHFLPYQLRSSPNTLGTKKPTKSNAKYSSMKSLSLSDSSMDNSLLEMEQGEENLSMISPTAEEAEELLKVTADEDLSPSTPGSETHAPDSPTAAVQAAIEAKMAENLDSLAFDIFPSVNVLNKDNSVASFPSLVPFTAPPPRKQPQPLFPEGLPTHFDSNTVPCSSGKPRGYFTNPAGGPETMLSKDSLKPMPTYASKAKSPPKSRVLVQNILYIYATKTAKKPISAWDWSSVDNHLIEQLNAQHPDDPTLVRIANSGYDAAHKCGFIACRDQSSEAWVKSALKVTAFRAWSKGEQPEVRLCRLFFPTRFDCLQDDRLIPLLRKHNPPLGQATLTLKGSDQVQGGRAIFIEMDAASYAHVKSKNHKLEFTMMDIDCQIYIPASKKATKIDGISKLPTNPVVRPPSSSSVTATLAAMPANNTPPVSTNATLAVMPAGKIPPLAQMEKTLAPSLGAAALTATSSAPSTSTSISSKTAQSFTEKFVEERKKRNRSSGQNFSDASKKSNPTH